MIDWKRVQELQEEVGEEDFDDVVEVFLIEMDETMDEFRASPAPRVSSDQLHFLKGSALNLGFQALGELCAALETQARSGDRPAAADLVQCYDRSRAHFLARFESGPAAA